MPFSWRPSRSLRLKALSGTLTDSWGFLEREKTIEVPRSLITNFFRRNPTQFPDLTRNFLHKCRLIALPPIWNWSKKRRIGLDENALKRDLQRRIANLLGFGKRHVPGERDHESHVECALRVRPNTGEAMQNSAEPGRPPVLLDQIEAIVPGTVAVIRWPAMNYDRQLRGVRK